MVKQDTENMATRQRRKVNTAMDAEKEVAIPLASSPNAWVGLGTEGKELCWRKW